MTLTIRSVGLDMNCQEIQSKVIPFINDELDGNECREFVEHVRICRKCREELSVYHAIYSIVDQLDNDREMTDGSYEEELERELNQTEQEVLWEGYARKLCYVILIILISLMATLSGN